MREFVITKQTEGTALLRKLSNILPQAPLSFLHKMLRKKNITVNGKRADASYILKDGDVINIFFSDETFDKFSGSLVAGDLNADDIPDLNPDSIIFEDEDIILVNKPCGILSQRAGADDVSMVEIIGKYLSCGGDFKPAVANRLDRNTSGIITAGKTVKGLKFLSDGFKSREFEKFYLCPVVGVIEQPRLFNGLWSKDSHGNKVKIRDVGWKPEDGRAFPKEYFVKGNVPVQTAVYPIKNNGRLTLLKVELLTGKTHQIRAQLSEAGFPLAGDFKYGERGANEAFKKKYGTEYQLLHAYSLKIAGKGLFFADIPEGFQRFLEEEDLWVHGIQEVFADRDLRI